jgi:uridylate kinase
MRILLHVGGSMMRNTFINHTTKQKWKNQINDTKKNSYKLQLIVESENKKNKMVFCSPDVDSKYKIL